MSIEKTASLVLSVMPYRESSTIAALLSRNYGRINGIAKGVRRSPQSPLTLERGQLVELVLYLKPHRDLHTIGAVSVINYFPAIRADLGRLALRDACFELILKSVTASETHGELFDFALAFLDRLEKLPGMPFPVCELWSFFHGWARLLGFLLNLRECVRCGSPRVASAGGMVVPEKGGLLCSSCARNAATAPSFLPGPAAAFLLGEGPYGKEPLSAAFTPGERIRITRLLADYCRYHLDIRSELKSLHFLETVLF